MGLAERELVGAPVVLTISVGSFPAFEGTPVASCRAFGCPLRVRQA